ncbi:hemerythrin domain-containing protein [Yoonia sp. 208BN28-4]|uniref:hemerythrin domain-containing protein n=1 Tax=Yoonia sp. 208BN28-4 TaxID=3126505 RepID=UPI0030A052B9
MDLTLAQRDRLPDALRALVAEFPRDAWDAHPNYSQLIAFWLDKHLSFRRLTKMLADDTDKALAGLLDPLQYQRHVSRLGGDLINHLHGHHQIEDAHYFPVMATLDQAAAAGFDILDRDHHAMDGLLNGLATDANAVLQRQLTDKNGLTTATSTFQNTLTDFTRMLDRHLVDEEELVVPVLLKYAPEQFR